MSENTTKKWRPRGPLVALVSILAVAFVTILIFIVVIPKNQQGVLYETENARIWKFGDSEISIVTEITKHDNGNLSWKRYVSCPDGTKIPWGAGEKQIPDDFYHRFAITEASISPEGDIVYFTREDRIQRPYSCEGR